MREKSILSLTEAFDRYQNDTNVGEKYLCSQLDEFSKMLAMDPEFRRQMPSMLPSLWTHVSELWTVTVSSFEETTFPDLILSLARFTRNLVAGVPQHQEAAFVNEPKIRGLLHRLSSFSLLEDSNFYSLTRMLVQTLSNLVTSHADLATRLWTLYTTLPEDQNIIMRLLVSHDSRTVISTLVLILNCVKTDNAGLRKLTSPIGLRIVVLLLDRTEVWVDQDDEEREESEAFTLAFRLFEALLDQGLGAALYHSLSIEDEPVTPHQTTFLKILDSYIQHQHERTTSETHENGHSFLAKAFVDIGSYCQRAIRRSLGLESTVHLDAPAQETTPNELKELDLRLPKASAALILISQCLTAICLQASQPHEAHAAHYSAEMMETHADGFVENLVETLRLVDRFLPRIVFGQAAKESKQPSLSTGNSTNNIDTTGFAYLKRDLVRLLGTICHERKGIQDRIRECGGIPVVMNLCVIDERNPYLQEHAIFALRNILYHNAENQGIVDAMKLEQG